MAVKRWNGTAWEVYAGADLAPVKVTDGRVGKTTFIGATSPTGQVDGDIWIDQDTTTNAVVPTALTTKGDIFAATGNAAYTRFAAGNNGESLYADSTTSTGLRWQGDFNTGKNKILNGDMNIWQRGVTFSADGYTADRWRFSKNASTTASISRQPFTLGTAPAVPYESQYFARYQRTAGAFDDYFLQRVEDARTLANTPSRLSFWAKASANINISQVYAAQTTKGSGGGASGVFGGVAITTSWVRYSIDINLPSLSGATLGAGNFVEVVFKFGSEMGNTTIDIWGVQWEAGSVTTPFTTNTANQQAELAACQRYCQVISDETQGGRAHLGVTVPQNSSMQRVVLFLPTIMRSAPSAAFVGSNQWRFIGTNNGALATITATELNRQICTFDASGSGLSGNNYVQRQDAASPTPQIILSAEL
jgi:hypothetical protein